MLLGTQGSLLDSRSATSRNRLCPQFFTYKGLANSFVFRTSQAHMLSATGVGPATNTFGIFGARQEDGWGGKEASSRKLCRRASSGSSTAECGLSEPDSPRATVWFAIHTRAWTLGWLFRRLGVRVVAHFLLCPWLWSVLE
ncbi:hypothetical protein TIFTF001_031328 [Ficus carica]|uniref:Uncharacterized protein n=1 Tax=Ficus carica TaxID=3494 RepID=A0AA88J5B8_FICCA|nr:hypothetical protein TIFTF001_031328 [Ficus carica]